MLNVGDREKAAACRLDTMLRRCGLKGQASVDVRRVVIDVADDADEDGTAVANALSNALEGVEAWARELARLATNRR